MGMLLKSSYVPHRYIFFFQLPYLPEILISSFDFIGFPEMFRRNRPKELSPVTDEDIEAFKYTFGQPGEY
jgi:hypothetical protein